MDPKHLQILRDHYAQMATQAPHMSATIQPYRMTADKRSQKRVIRELIEAGYLEDRDDDYHITTKVFEEFPPESVDLIREYDERYKADDQNTHYPYVVVDRLTAGQKMALLELEDVHWHALAEVVVDFRVALDEANHLHGDGSQGEAAKHVRENWFNAQRSRLVVTSEALKEHADRVRFQGRMDYCYPRNLDWGLCEQGLIEEGEAEDFKAAMFNPADLVWFPGTEPKVKPAEWERQLHDNQGFIREQIKTLTRRAELLARVEGKIREQGGWVAFEEAYRRDLTAELKKKTTDEG